MINVGMIGAFDVTHSIVCGQSDKTELFYSAIKNIVGEDNIFFLNTFNWKRNVFKLFCRCTRMICTCSRIILMTSENGTKALYPFLGIAKKILKKPVFHIVIGGKKNVDLIKSSKRLRSVAKRIDALFVELPELINDYNNLGINRVVLVPNCKTVNTSPLPNIDRNNAPYRFCVYSRINKVKGIPEAIDAVITLNQQTNYKCTLDIYGVVEESFQDEFDRLLKKSKEYVRFCGKIDRSSSRDVLCQYYALLFPTHHPEGVPGGVIDSYEAGLPVIACNTFYIERVIKNMTTGILYDENDTQGLCKAIEYVIVNPVKVDDMRKECVKEAIKYDSGYVLNDMMKKMGLT